MTSSVSKIELTAPAGGWDQLKAAVNAGADSIYLGYKKFGARAYAENFDMRNLRRAVSFSHNNDVKVYLTLNTLVRDCEMPEVINFLKEYTSICSDGIIVQDYGIYKLIKDLFMDVPVHASTQMNIHNVYSLKLLKDMGFKRVILAREMTIDEIKNLCASNLLEIEAFGHGSQCYSYSGNCYFSSFIGGRSGNRGRCSQPCRMKYRLAEKENERINYIISDGSYLFSKSDLCVLDMIPEVISSGADALKIEGRMKSPEYVGIVTKIYRKYIDLYYKSPSDYKIDDYDLYRLTQIFSRELGPGYLKEKHPKDIISIKKSGSIGNFLGRVYKVEFENNGFVKNRKIKSVIIKSNWKINSGDIIEIWTKKGSSRVKIRDPGLIGEENKKYRYRIALNKKSSVLEKDRVFKYFDKRLDDEAKSLFTCGPEKHEIKNIKISKISGSRQGNKEIESYKGKFLPVNHKFINKPSDNIFTLSSYIYDCRDIETAVKEGAGHIIYSNFDELMINMDQESEKFRILKDYSGFKSIKVSVNTPSIIYDGQFDLLKNNILKFMDFKINSFKVSNPGVLKLLSEISMERGSDIDIYLSFNFNLFNSLSLLFFSGLLTGGIVLKGVELSPELNLEEISKSILNFKNSCRNKLELSIFGHGYFPVMNSRYKVKFLTGKKTGSCFIEDIKGYRFPVDTDYNENMIIFNSKNFCTFFELGKILKSGVNNIIIDSKFFKKKDFNKIIKIYSEAVDILLKKGEKKYKDFSCLMKDDQLFKNYSKGHLLRGVE